MKKNNILVASVVFSSIMPLRADLELVDNIPKSKDHYYQYLVATYQHSSGKALPALEAYKQLIKTNPSPYVYHGFFQLLFDMGQFKNIIDTYQSKQAELAKQFDKDISMQLILAQSYLEIDQNAKAEQIFLRLASSHPDNEQIAYFAAVAYLKNNQLEKALEFSNKCLKNKALKQKYFLFHFINSKILIQQNKLPQALAQIEKSLSQFPKFDRALLFKAVLLEQMGKINDAISGYKNFLDLVGHDLPVEKQLTQLLFRQNRFNEALEYLKRIDVKSPEYFFDLALIELKAGNTQKALDCIDKVLEMAPDFTKAKLFKIEVLLQSNRIPEVLTFMKNWILADVSDIAVIDTFLLLGKAGVQKALLIKTLQEIEQNKPHINVLAAIADLYRELNNHAQAIAYYQKVVPLTQDQALKSKTLFQIGYLYFVTKQPANLEKTLNEALSFAPAYPSAYNLLAYHYAHTNKNLPEALELINKALAIAPRCYYYLDTKGYVLFKQGLKDQAISVYKQALEFAPQDKVIKKHLKIAQGGV